MDEPPKKRRPSVAQLSKTPSWIMLGFLLGAAFVWALPRREPEPRPIVITRSEPEPRTDSSPRLLTTIEAVFEQWQDLAVWDQNLTQVAMWNPRLEDFTEFYEVRRADGVFYYRSLSKLTNRLIRHGKEPPPECPLRFTETEEQYREWREEGRFERPVERPRLTVPRAVPERPRAEVDDLKPLSAPETGVPTGNASPSRP